MNRGRKLSAFVVAIWLTAILCLPEIASAGVYAAYGSSGGRVTKASGHTSTTSRSRAKKHRARRASKKSSQRKISSASYRSIAYPPAPVQAPRQVPPPPVSSSNTKQGEYLYNVTYELEKKNVSLRIGDCLDFKRNGQYIGTVEIIHLHPPNKMCIRYKTERFVLLSDDKFEIRRLQMDKPESEETNQPVVNTQRASQTRQVLDNHAGQPGYTTVDLNLWRQDGSMFLNPSFRVEIYDGSRWLVYDPVNSSTLATDCLPGKWGFGYHPEDNGLITYRRWQEKELTIGEREEVNIFIDNDCEPATIVIWKR